MENNRVKIARPGPANYPNGWLRSSYRESFRVDCPLRVPVVSFRVCYTLLAKKVNLTRMYF